MRSNYQRALVASLMLLAISAQARTYHCADTTSDTARVLATSAIEPEPSPPGGFTIAMLPDVQYYTECQLPHLAAQMRWIAGAAATHDISAALFMGDLTEHNSPIEWQYFREQIALAQDRVPLVLATGNHDEGRNGSARWRSTRLTQYFPSAPGVAQ